MYKIAFLLLKFLCIQAMSAARKAEEVGFVDHAHFPELPMPVILHDLQDQGLAIVAELCEGNKAKEVEAEIEDVCLLLLQITTMALYLEFYVIQICGIRPVLGHVDTFSKELRLLVRATEGRRFLKEALKDLKQIVSYVLLLICCIVYVVVMLAHFFLRQIIKDQILVVSSTYSYS